MKRTDKESFVADFQERVKASPTLFSRTSPDWT
jgi:hypothetical protein